MHERPAPDQLWRSVLEWLGGVGVIVLALSFADVAHPPRALYAVDLADGHRAEPPCGRGPLGAHG